MRNKKELLRISFEEVDSILSQCEEIEDWYKILPALGGVLNRVRVFKSPEWKFSKEVELDGEDKEFTAKGFVFWDPRYEEFRIVLFESAMPYYEGILMHELLHILEGHPFMLKPNQLLWELSVDAWVNETLRRMGYNLPPDNIFPEIFREITGVDVGYLPPSLYYALFDDEEEELQKLLQLLNDFFIPTDDPKAMAVALGIKSALSKTEKGRELIDSLSKFSLLGGITPGDQELLLQDREIEIPKWYSRLLSYLSKEWSYRKSRTWRREGRMPFLPAHGERLRVLPSRAIIAIDVSGSMSSDEVFWLNALSKRLAKDVKGDLLYFDARIVKVCPLGTSVEKLPGGGGGTDYRPVLEYVKQKGKEAVLILCTDGFPCIWPELDVKAIVVCTTGADIPWSVPVFRTKEG